MAITRASVTSGSNNGNASSYATASITPSANKLQLLSVANTRNAGSPTTPTVTGCGLTWVQVNTVSDGTNRRITFFRAMGASPTTGTLTIDYGGVTQNNTSWSLNEFDGIDTTGTNGSGAIVQSVTNTGSAVATLTVTLAAFGSTNNGACSGFVVDNNLAISPDTGWTEMHEVQVSDGADSHTNETQWRADNDTTAAASWTGNQKVAGIAIEIKAASSGTNYTSTLTDTISLTETIIKNPQKVLSDTSTLTENFSKGPRKVLSDSASLTETILKNPQKVLSDAISLSEAFAKNPQKVLSDSVSMTEAFIKSIQRELDDSFSLTEQIAKQIQRNLTDAISLTEIIEKLTGKTLADSVTLTETFLIGLFHFLTLTDSITLSDAISERTLSRVIAESLSLTEIFVESVINAILATVEGKVVQKMIAMLSADSTVTGYVGDRISIAYPSTIQDEILACIKIKIGQGAGRFTGGAFLDDLKLQVQIHMPQIGANAKTWDDAMILQEAILGVLHRSGGWDEVIGIKIIEMTNIEEGPQSVYGPGIMFYPSQWRVLATL